MLQLKEYHLKSETSSQYNIMIIIIINYLELGWTLSMRIRLLPWRFLVFGANINKLRKLITQNLRRKNQSQIPIIIAEITPHTPAKNIVKIPSPFPGHFLPLFLSFGSLSLLMNIILNKN